MTDLTGAERAVLLRAARVLERYGERWKRSGLYWGQHAAASGTVQMGAGMVEAAELLRVWSESGVIRGGDDEVEGGSGDEAAEE